MEGLEGEEVREWHGMPFLSAVRTEVWVSGLCSVTEINFAFEFVCFYAS